MNSIHSCTPSPQSGIPAVILVGTHVDKIPEKYRQKVINTYFMKIRHLLKDKPTIVHLMCDIAIDNTLHDPKLKELKRNIFNLASQQPHWGEEKPARWLPLEQAIMTLKASGTKVVRVSLLDEINRSASVRIQDKDEMDLFLRYQHEIGSILYFNAEGLRDSIVLDPQFIIDALKSLITAEMFIRAIPVITSKWFEFKEDGKLAHQLIDAIWTKEKNPDFHDNKNHLLLLMEKLNLIARPKSYSEDRKEVKEEDYFLAPCMLRQATPTEIISPESDPDIGNTSVLCFVCTAKFLPTPVFHRLLGACLTYWPIAKQGSQNLIYCGCCVFDIDDVHQMTLHFRDYVIFTRVTGVGVINMHQSSEVCGKVKTFIFENLSRIIGNLGQSLQFELHIQCPRADPKSLEGLIAVSKLQRSEKVRCHSHAKSHILESKELLKFWFEDKEPSDAGSSSGAMATPPRSDTDRFMCIAYLLVDVGSRVLRQLLSHHTVTSTCTLDQYLAKHRNTINSLRRVFNQSQMDIMFPPNGDDTNLDDYDITLLSALFNNIVPTLSQQEKDMIKCLREERNKLYGHAKSCQINSSDFQTYCNDISSTLTTLSQQCGDTVFEAKILQEIHCTQVSAIPADPT
ncbi:hypothetical protein CHS0354_007955 [Potamilus streckersoni]|uniref:C-terminal of Roc (COR) domain-containing protein n=1 Tax=Potamilus streckersoni TaxID=2493646 RepID=A0AAE0S955_9BIVA|nr:hypothetical protein CHS0354_007955 [Potamilus streckersoni]